MKWYREEMTKKILLSSVLFIAACGGDSRRENGESCEKSPQCESELCATAFGDGTEISGGMCTAECEWNEDLSDTCPEGEICLRYSATGEKLCFMDCASDEDCRTEEEWSCLPFNADGSGACIPPL